MKSLKSYSILLLAALAVTTSCSTTESTKSYNEGINIIPMPNSLVVTSEDRFTLKGNTTFGATQAEAATIAEFFASKIGTSTGYSIGLTEGGKGSIELIIDQSISDNEQAYELEILKDKVQVTGASAAALFYGMQSFMQLLPAEIESKTPIRGVEWSAPTVKISDAPRFEYRGIMFDVCRHFVSVEFLKKQIDVLSLFKINHLHWHLTEDQAWRVEIKKYPLLTEVGAFRVEPDGDGTPYGGFYTQDEIREVVAYAAERFITIVPEFELPGHELAAIAAYPHLSCKGEEISPRVVWGVEDIVMCPAKETTFEFIEDVIDELAPLFPGKYFHVGGDECPKTSWEQCPACQQFIRQNGLEAKDGHSAEERLQSYVIHRAEEMLAKHGKQLVGWDEILEGGLSDGATVMSWRGEEGGVAAASMGRKVIMAPQTEGMYLNFYQGDYMIEPVTIGGYVPLSNTYSYNPVPEELRGTDKESLVIGVQSNLWSEYMYEPEIVEYQAYPRALALSEVGWSKTANKDLDGFCRRLDNAYVRLDAHDINYYIAQPEQSHGSTNYVAFTTSAVLEFTSTIPVKMVYTLDGSEPSPKSKQYTTPLTFSETTTLKIRSLLPSCKMSQTREISIIKEELRQAVEVSEAKNGLKVTSTPGNYLNMAELSKATAKSESRIAATLEDLVIRKTYECSMRNLDQEANIGEGYINIAEDGVYHFWTNNNELWIAGEKIIDNDNEVKRFSRQGRSIALSKGLHPIKTIWLGNIIGGWPSNWDDGAITLRKEEETEYRYIGGDELFYE
ncbi:MAG: family 20 glycosylhydrolase [Rikenellaceae bacterium]